MPSAYRAARESRLPMILYGNKYNSDAHKLMMGVIDCTRCKARLECKAPVTGVGNLDAKIMLLGRNPGKNEDKDGIPFVGQGGQLLDNWIQWASLDRNNLYISNMVKCYTRDDRKPEADEITACTHWFQQELKLVQPKLIITFGEQATTFVVGYWQGARLKLHQRGYNDCVFTVIAAIHPGAPLRNTKFMKDFKDDAYYAKAMINHPASGLPVALS